ncbi:MAG: hydroxyacid dehydrogenase [Kiritimatiellaeota bacterium]|nr:hydroxyacid dehydrogenase [Kiritimatiellota bacterium]
MDLLCLVKPELFDQCFPPHLRTELGKLGRIDFPTAEQLALPDAAYGELLRKYDVLLGGWGARGLPRDYSPAPRQLWCHLTGSLAGQVHPDHLRRGLHVTNWGDAISHLVAEAALTLILASVRHLGLYYDATHTRKAWFRPKEFRSLFERNVGLIGFGSIARALVKLLRPFQVRILAYDPYVPGPVFSAWSVQRTGTLPELFSSCDVISIHAARTPETDRLITADLLALLPDHGVLVNTGRGNILDEYALAAEHARGRLFSGLDVFDPEPPAADHPLRDQPRCLMTCHRGGPTTDQYDKMGRRAIDNIRRFKAGQPLIQELTPETLMRMT